MAIFGREHEPPDLTEGDAAHAVVRAALGAIPVIGDATVEVLNHVLAPPIALRQREWMEDIAAAVRALEENLGISPDELRDNPIFIDAVMSASQAAIRTSQQDKKTALRNAVVNSVRPGAPEASVQQMFIAFVDRFTEWHLRVLRLFQEPKRWAGPDGRSVRPGNSLGGVIENAFEDLRGRRELYDQIWADLGAAGFHRSGGLHVTMTPEGTLSKRTTEFADQFLKFIEDPGPS